MPQVCVELSVIIKYQFVNLIVITGSMLANMITLAVIIGIGDSTGRKKIVNICF